ncbi:hypothetical protein AB6A40_000875 [Gnathostoma spinigerum]|uniref:Uncharacterized protein n=1 Tax=Gnathostoma spinigerum TaxID=75299 RepID=A0ABD6E477_9BILA
MVTLFLIHSAQLVISAVPNFIISIHEFHHAIAVFFYYLTCSTAITVIFLTSNIYSRAQQIGQSFASLNLAKSVRTIVFLIVVPAVVVIILHLFFRPIQTDRQPSIGFLVTFYTFIVPFSLCAFIASSIAIMTVIRTIKVKKQHHSLNEKNGHNDGILSISVQLPLLFSFLCIGVYTFIQCSLKLCSPITALSQLFFNIILFGIFCSVRNSNMSNVSFSSRIKSVAGRPKLRENFDDELCESSKILIMQYPFSPISADSIESCSNDAFQHHFPNEVPMISVV